MPNQVTQGTPHDILVGTIKNLQADRSHDNWDVVNFMVPFDKKLSVVVIAQCQTRVGGDTPGLRIKDVNHKVRNTNTPVVLDNTIAYLVAEAIEEVNIGTHIIFIGKVPEAEILNDKEPMTYAYVAK